jgi:hypothetical protein
MNQVVTARRFPPPCAYYKEKAPTVAPGHSEGVLTGARV